MLNMAPQRRVLSLLGLRFALIYAFLAVTPFLTFRMETFTLRYYILEVRRLGFVAAVVVVVLIL